MTAPHPRMSKAELRTAYWRAWDQFYTPEHAETAMRRAKARGASLKSIMWKMLAFYAIMRFEEVHPLDGGLFRRRVRRDRRHGLPIEPAWRFYPRRLWEECSKYARFLPVYWHYRQARRRVERDPRPYTDAAIAPVDAAELGRLEMFTGSEAARAAVVKVQRRQAARAAARA